MKLNLDGDSEARFGQYMYMQNSIAKEKSGVKKWMEIYAIKGGVRRLMANAIFNFHFFKTPL